MNRVFRPSTILGLFLVIACGAGFSRAAPNGSSVFPLAASAGGDAKATQGAPAASSSDMVTIPGSFRSFLRMAAISQKINLDEALPFLARNVVVNGYKGSQEKADQPTEFLTLLRRYLGQARELQALAGPQQEIRVAGCADAGQLLTILGFEQRGDCGLNVTLETADPDRAFITIDSGFPVAQLEEALRDGKPFTAPFASSVVPVIFSIRDWITTGRPEKGANAGDLLDLLVREPSVARLYWAMARMDPQTRVVLRQSPGLAKLLPHASVLDFYGSELAIRGGRIMVPGGAKAEAKWADLAGASPANPSDFVLHLLSKDEGWLAAYFEALSRTNAAQQPYFTEPQRLQHFYEALRGSQLTPSPARYVFFRPDPGLLLLVTRLQFEASGEPHIPGDMQTWRDILRKENKSKLAAEWVKRSRNFERPDQLIEAMFGLSRIQTAEGPLQVFLALSEIDRSRSAGERLTPSTVRLLADQFSRYSDQYPALSEFGALDNASITAFVATAESLDKIRDVATRGNAVGIFQADLGLWQVLARQGQIPRSAWNESWKRVIRPFSGVGTATQLFDAGQASLVELIRSIPGQSGLSQEQLVMLLAGPEQADPEGQRVRQQMAAAIRAVMEAQRLVSLDTLLALRRGLDQVAQGNVKGDSLLPLAAEIREFELPRPLFTNFEKNQWNSGFPNSSHANLQQRTDIAKIINSSPSSRELTDARGLLAPFLRDTLVGLNYAYYEPPGAQMLLHNPLFVRFHDFSGTVSTGGGQAWQTASLFGRGWAVGGGAHLVGSLADLPYVLAQVEQDFIVPENVQALVWEDMVPSLLSDAVMTRWWGVSRDELHAVALYQRAGEELLAESSQSEAVRKTVMEILSNRMLPRTADLVETSLQAGKPEQAMAWVAPADTFFLAIEFRRRFPEKAEGFGPAGKELEALSRSDPAASDWQAISRDFGVPHPALAQNNARELLEIKPFPTFLGYSSRLMAECWDSSNLYWARLADEMGYSPVTMNRLVPELTRRMVEKIFASHFEDWAAVLRAMRETGDEFRQGKIVPLPKRETATGF